MLELEYNFIDVSQDQNRRSEVWQYFWLDKKRAVARCKPCMDKGTSKILIVANVCILSLLKVHISYIFLKKIQVFFKLLEKNLTWNFKFKSSQVLLQQVQVRSSSSSAWPGTSSQVKFEHFQVFWTLLCYYTFFLSFSAQWHFRCIKTCRSTIKFPKSIK
mgnify:CR=1 FL=1